MLSPTFCRLADLLAERRFAVLTGAGCSTESGIPDYRGPETRRRVRSPIFYQEFVRDPEARRRYWARSAVGWERVARARPNAAHRALARLEASGFIGGLITQNVDGLHGAAGSRDVVELHGSLERVRCLGCGASESRVSVQRRLLELNPGWSGDGLRAAPPEADAERPDPNQSEDGPPAQAPDGDAVIPERATAAFRVADCLGCAGVLKPDVVFFGENVPPPRLAAAWRAFKSGAALLVVGSSLAVYSGYRFVERAAREDRPVAIVNLGSTRGDDAAAVRVQGRAGDVLPLLADELLGTSQEPVGRPRTSPAPEPRPVRGAPDA